MGDFGGGGEVGDRPQRVGRRLGPDQLGTTRLHRGAQCGERGHVDEIGGEVLVGGACRDPAAQAVIHDQRRDNMRARRQAVEHRRGGRHAGGEDERGGAAFEGGDQRLGLVVAGVVGAGIVAAAAVFVVGIAQEGRRGMDRQDDGAGLLVDPAERLGRQRRRMGRIARHVSILPVLGEISPRRGYGPNAVVLSSFAAMPRARRR